MIDHRARRWKDAATRVLVAPLPQRTPAWPFTVTSVLLSLGAAGLAAAGLRWLPVALWLLGRICDGVDGVVARRSQTASDRGGLADIVGDTIGYAAVPLGVAAHQANAGVWAATAVLLATFYVNTTVWTYLAAIAEKRGRGAATTSEVTTVHMPSGLVEGAETIVWYTAMLAFPGLALWWCWSMAGAVALTVVQRLLWARRHL